MESEHGNCRAPSAFRRYDVRDHRKRARRCSGLCRRSRHGGGRDGRVQARRSNGERSWFYRRHHRRRGIRRDARKKREPDIFRTRSPRGSTASYSIRAAVARTEGGAGIGDRVCGDTAVRRRYRARWSSSALSCVEEVLRIMTIETVIVRNALLTEGVLFCYNSG